MTRLPASALRLAPTLTRPSGSSGPSLPRPASMPSRVLQRAQAPAQMVLPFWGPVRATR